MRNHVERKKHELSFTLLEVIVAVGLLTSVVLQVASGQGSLFEVTDYSRRATEATWLAKRLMSQVEYNYANLEMKELEMTSGIKDEPFKDLEGTDGADYRYSIKINEWKFPLLDILMNGGPNQTKEEKEENPEESSEADKGGLGGLPGADAVIKQIFDGHILKIAHVEVSWPEGASRNSVALTYLLTNQKAMDTYILTKKATWESVRKKMDPNAGQQGQGGNPATNPDGTPITGGGGVNTGGGGVNTGGGGVNTGGGGVNTGGGGVNTGGGTNNPGP